MQHLPSSPNKYRVLFWLWGIAGALFLAVSLSAPSKALERNQQAVTALAESRAAAEKAKQTGSATPEAAALQQALFARATERAAACVKLLEKDRPQDALVASVEEAMTRLESGQAFVALKALLELAGKDRAKPDSPWTPQTPIIERALAETRYKIALMCKEGGDGFEDWSKYAEAAARSYLELAERAPSAKENQAYLRSLAVCTRLIHGGDDATHSLGFPACRTIDCVLIARTWKRPPPGGGGGGSNSPPEGKKEQWKEPPEPNQSTQGR